MIPATEGIEMTRLSVRVTLNIHLLQFLDGNQKPSVLTVTLVLHAIAIIARKVHLALLKCLDGFGQRHGSIVHT